MFVYVWSFNNEPFYVGMSKSIGRTNPLNAGGRGWLCKQTLEKVGRKNVVTELHIVNTVEEAKTLERSLIEKYGRIQLGTGSLTNLKPGGDGSPGMSDAGKASLSKFMRTNNPMKNPETRAKLNERMQSPEVIALFSGDNNPAKRPEVRAKLKAKWADPEYRELQTQKKIGRSIHSEESKELRRQRLLDPNNPMRDFHKVLNSDPTIKEKRTKALQSPEVRAKISAALRAKWAERKAIKSS